MKVWFSNGKVHNFGDGECVGVKIYDDENIVAEIQTSIEDAIDQQLTNNQNEQFQRLTINIPNTNEWLMPIGIIGLDNSETQDDDLVDSYDRDFELPADNVSTGRLVGKDMDQFEIRYPDGDSELVEKEKFSENISQMFKNNLQGTSTTEMKTSKDTTDVEFTNINKINRTLIKSFVGTVPEHKDLAIVNIVTVPNGIFEVRPVGSYIFTKMVSDKNYVPPIADGPFLEDGISSGLPLIPIKILSETIQFFREILEKYGTEAIVRIYYSHKNKQFFIWIPFQVVKETTVTWLNQGTNKEELQKFYENGDEWIMDIHSHANMDAFFSSGAKGTDDEDEKNDGAYGVVGSVGTSSPTMEFRLRIGTEFFTVEVNELFDFVSPDSKTKFDSFIDERIEFGTKKFNTKQSQPSVGKTLVPSTSIIESNFERELTASSNQAAIIASKIEKGEIPDFQLSGSKSTFRVIFSSGATAIIEKEQLVQTPSNKWVPFYLAAQLSYSIKVPQREQYSIMQKVVLHEEISFSQSALGSRPRNKPSFNTPPSVPSSKYVHEAFRDIPPDFGTGLALELTMDAVAETAKQLDELGLTKQ